MSANEVTVSATNVSGRTTACSVTVLVNDDVGYPGPTLAVGPDQLHWQLAAGVAGYQQRGHGRTQLDRK